MTKRSVVLPVSPTTEPGPSEDSGTSVRSVDRAVAILRCFTTRLPIMTVAQIQSAVGLSRPTVYRLLETLEGLGLIQSDGNPQRFQLAHGVMEFARVWMAGLNLPELAQPIVEEVRDATGETAALFVPRGELRICVLEYRSHEVLAMSRGVGSTGCLSEGASGKAMLAFMDGFQQARSLAKARGTAEHRRLSDDLSRTTRLGYALSRGEVFTGAVAVAAPVFDDVGNVAGSLGIYGPDSRMNDDRVAESAKVVMDAAGRLSALMGCPPSRLPISAS